MWTSDPTPIIAQLMDLDKRGHLGNIMTIMIFVIIYVIMMRMMRRRKGKAAHNGAQWRSHCGHRSHWPNFGKRLDGDDYGEDFDSDQ